jgi:hypothetical protein
MANRFHPAKAVCSDHDEIDIKLFGRFDGGQKYICKDAV